jgi:hypothetical protein
MIISLLNHLGFLWRHGLRQTNANRSDNCTFCHVLAGKHARIMAIDTDEAHASTYETTVQRMYTRKTTCTDSPTCIDMISRTQLDFHILSVPLCYMHIDLSEQHTYRLLKVEGIGLVLFIVVDNHVIASELDGACVGFLLRRVSASIFSSHVWVRVVS